MLKLSIKYLSLRSYLLHSERKINLLPVYSSPIVNNIFNYLHINNSSAKKKNDIETPNGKRKRNDDTLSDNPSTE